MDIIRKNISLLWNEFTSHLNGNFICHKNWRPDGKIYICATGARTEDLIGYVRGKPTSSRCTQHMYRSINSKVMLLLIVIYIYKGNDLGMCKNRNCKIALCSVFVHVVRGRGGRDRTRRADPEPQANRKEECGILGNTLLNVY